MNIMLPGQRPLVVPSAVVQARQRLGSEAVRQVFDLTQKSWHEAASQRQQTTHSRCFISYLPSHELPPHRPAHLEETAKTLTSE
nr:transposase domain-containing protein [Pseudomonas corrugata]